MKKVVETTHKRKMRIYKFHTMNFIFVASLGDQFNNVYELFNLGPCLISPKPDLDFKIRFLKPWGCKQTESGFLKPNEKSGCSFYSDVTNYQFYLYEFYQNVIVLFH